MSFYLAIYVSILAVLCVIGYAALQANKLWDRWETMKRDLREANRKVSEQSLEIAILTTANHMQALTLARKQRRESATVSIFHRPQAG